KISLFAAQNGIKQVAGKGKVEIQAQGDGADFIARKDIQIISTEDTIYIISPKEIVFTAESSQLKLNGSGIFPTTGGKFEVKAGQHLFKSGGKVAYELPVLPSLDFNLDQKSMKFDLSQLDTLSDFSQSKYRIYKRNGAFHEGFLDAKGRTKRISSSDMEELELFVDHPDFVVEEEFFVEPNDNLEN
ncbi:DUF2345 domain-containing protein, partial [Acinetobacter haemolyticus]|uniref:DUF2345 domain-containing protein n=1 Tax=Acinetobacter haemolyticus TaxID=29430 RepID=UPI0012985C03